MQPTPADTTDRSEFVIELDRFGSKAEQEADLVKGLQILFQATGWVYTMAEGRRTTVLHIIKRETWERALQSHRLPTSATTILQARNIAHDETL